MPTFTVTLANRRLEYVTVIATGPTAEEAGKRALDTTGTDEFEPGDAGEPWIDQIEDAKGQCVGSFFDPLTLAGPAPAKVFVVNFSSGKTGDACDVFATREAAEAHRRTIAIDNWAEVMDEPMPADPDEAADTYWERQSDRGEDQIAIEECEVNGATPAQSNPVEALSDALTAATVAGVLDRLAGDLHPDAINAFCDAVTALAGTPARENPAPAQGSSDPFQQLLVYLETAKAALAGMAAHMPAIRELVIAAEAAGWDQGDNASLLQKARDSLAALTS